MTGVRPVVGIVAGRHQVPRPWGVLPVQGTTEPLPDVLAAAGALPVVVPVLAPGALAAADLLGAVDALLLAGGGDLDPATYGADPHPRTEGADRLRDDTEVALARAAIELDLPVLGLCRGMQILNVALGGDLVQHVDGHLLTPPATHPITTVPGSLVAQLAGARPEVGSLHHQAVGRLGHGLVATAASDDGVPEALELPGRAVLGVQWHPELQPGAVQKALLDWLVRSARP